MGTDSLNPLNELKVLEQHLDQVLDLNDLKPIFFRLDEIARTYSGDFDVQLAVSDLKQRVIDRGRLLKHAAELPPIEPVAGYTSHAAPETLRTRPDTPSSSGIPAAESPAAEDDGSSTGAFTAIPAGPPPGFPPLSAAPVAAGSNRSWKRSVLLGALAGAVIAVIVIALLVNQARKRNLTAGPALAVRIGTVPTGAAIRINGEDKCTSDCSLSLPPGKYQITAFLDGFEPAVSELNLEPRRPANITLPLEPQAQSIRILADIEQGKVAIDDRPPTDLQDGQFSIEKVPPGSHTVKVTSRTGEAFFTVQIAEGKQPQITGPITARNVIAVLVSSVGTKAHVLSSSGPLKFAVNGEPQPDLTPAGVELANFVPGVDELIIGQGKDQKSMKESFGPAPMVTAFLKSDLNIGTLIVSTGEDDVRVFINNKEYPRKTTRGQVRIPAIGPVNVHVTKDGFEPVAPQTAEIKKGSEVRLEFKMQPSPKFASLQIRGATPGAEVLLDQKSTGTVGDDGSFVANAIQPGDHAIELRKDQFLPKRVQRSFHAGQPVMLTGADVTLAPALGTVRINRLPADAQVIFRHAEQASNQNQEARGEKFDLPPGNYVFTGIAPGFIDKSVPVQVLAGETRTVEIALARVVQAPPPSPKIGGMPDFEDPSAWKQEGPLFTHRGAGFLAYKTQPKGTFTFTIQLLHGGNIFRGGKIRWAVQYVDARNYDLFELDQRYLWSKVIIAGKTYERGKFDHNLTEKDKTYSIQIDISPEKLIHRVLNSGEWIDVDVWSEPGRNFTQGKFGFIVQGNDEIGVSDFKFVPR